MVEGQLLVDSLFSVWWIALVAALAPIFALVTRRYVPDVVWLLVFGALLGPHALGLAEETAAVEFLRELGMGFLFLLAGFEVNTADMRGRQGKHAAFTWVICASLGLAAGLLFTQGEIQVAIVFAIASTSTALGTLIPILKDSQLMGTALGRATMTHGAFGELLPIIAMSLLLSSYGTWQAALVLLMFFVAAVVIVLPVRLLRRIPLLGMKVVSAANTTMQTTVRMTVLFLVTLMLLTAVLELDIALGAFAAGLLLNGLFKAVAPNHGEEIAHKVEVVGFSFLIPVFFVTSGMGLDLGAVLSEWVFLLGFVGTIAVVRGLVVFGREKLTPTYSGLGSTRDQLALGLYSATGLPIIVAVTQVAESSGVISATVASVMVTGGALTVLVFPFIAGLATRGSHPESASIGPAD